MSNRDKKRTVAAGLRALKARPGWDPAKAPTTSAADRLQQAQSSLRTEATYQQAADCAACDAQRAEDNDPGALCEAHLAEAMGL